MKQLKEYTLEQITDAEKLCQLIQNIPESQRQILTVSMIAYMSGVEAGIALNYAERKSEADGFLFAEKKYHDFHHKTPDIIEGYQK